MPEILKYIIYVLAGLYCLLAIIPAIQLVRIQRRVPDLGWTTQKLFLCLTLLSSVGRILLIFKTKN